MVESCSKRRLWDDLELSAACDAPVLISSDDSVDAEAVGLWIHRQSARRTGPFTVLDARTLDPDLHPDARCDFFEYGHTGFASLAAADSPGAGTLLLTHLEAMPPGLQLRFCRFLDRRDVGGPSMCRVVATTDQFVLARVRAGQIREELFYRLNVIHIALRRGFDGEGRTVTGSILRRAFAATS